MRSSKLQIKGGELMKKEIYKIDTKGFIIGNYLGEFDEKGTLVDPVGEYVVTALPQPLPFYKPKWNGVKWIEGATQEEIDELTKVEPSPPTEIELLKQRLEGMESALVDLILGGM